MHDGPHHRIMIIIICRYLYTGTMALFVDNVNNRTQSAGPTSQHTHIIIIIITIHIILLYAQYLVPTYIIYFISTIYIILCQTCRVQISHRTSCRVFRDLIIYIGTYYDIVMLNIIYYYNNMIYERRYTIFFPVFPLGAYYFECTNDMIILY